MSEIDDRANKNVREWMSFAESDLKFAQYGLYVEAEQAYRIVAYHAQQCAEKSLKAYLVYQKVDFPYTHNILQLLNVCGETAEWVSELQDAKNLTLYASTLRYPGQSIKVTKEEAIQAIEIAEHVCNVVKNALIAKGLDL
jgi:HEPN domain-containing protein